MEANFTNNGTVQLGSKYYNDDHLYRVLAFKNSETARVLDLVTKEVLRIPIEELKKVLGSDGKKRTILYDKISLPNYMKRVLNFS